MNLLEIALILGTVVLYVLTILQVSLVHKRSMRRKLKNEKRKRRVYEARDVKDLVAAMSGSEFLAIVTVSGIFTIIGISLMFYFWILKQEYRHKYLIKRYNLSKADKKNVITPAAVEQPTMLSNVAKILPALQNVDLDQLGDLLDRFQGGGEVEPEGGMGDIANLLANPAIAGLIQGVSKQQKPPDQDPGVIYES